MSRFWRLFTGWYVALLSFFVLANLAGVVRPMGYKPYRKAGFPFTVAAWGTDSTKPLDWWAWGTESPEAFDRSAMALNVAVAVTASGLVAWVCARARCQCEQKSQACRA